MPIVEEWGSGLWKNVGAGLSRDPVGMRSVKPLRPLVLRFLLFGPNSAAIRLPRGISFRENREIEPILYHEPCRNSQS